MSKEFEQITKSMDLVVLDLSSQEGQVVLKSGELIEFRIGGEKYSYTVPEGKKLILATEEISGVLLDE